MRVLIVDDDDGPRRLLSEVVRRIGAVADGARSVTEARALLAAHPYACALIDKNLDHESGIDLLTVIRERWPQTEAIIITGYPNVTSAVDALRLGAADYFAKPLDVATITHRLKVVLERRALLRDHRHLPTLIHTERMATLGRLSAGLAHELNNPLTFLCGHLELAAMSLQTLKHSGGARVEEECDKLAQSLKEAQVGLQRIRGMINDLRAFSRPAGTDDQVVDPHRAVEGAITVCNHELKMRAKLVRDFQATRPALGDQGTLMQVFTNLLVNAAQALSDSYDRNEIRVSSRNTASGLMIEVRDNGTGITDEVLPRLFEPFFTTKPQGVGTGLGLSISRTLVERCGGRIEVETTPGTGSAFRVHLRSPS